MIFTLTYLKGIFLFHSLLRLWEKGRKLEVVEIFIIKSELWPENTFDRLS